MKRKLYVTIVALAVVWGALWTGGFALELSRVENDDTIPGLAFYCLGSGWLPLTGILAVSRWWRWLRA
jgi:hypothetical protein